MGNEAIALQPDEIPKEALALAEIVGQSDAVQRLRPALSRTAILILVAILSMICFVVETQAAPVITYSFSDVDFPGADFSQAFGLNDRGQVVGAAGPLPPPGQRLEGEFGFVFSSGQFTQFAVPNAPIGTELFGINNSGTIVGVFGSPGQGLLLQEGSFNPIIFPGAMFTSTPGINDRGDIVGDYAFDLIGPSFSHGFILRNGQFTSIPDPPGLVNPNVHGINNRGDIVGFGYDASGAPHGFMFDGTNFTSIDVPGASQSIALGINDRGQIVGEVVLDDGTRISGFLLDHQAFTLIDVPGAFSTAIYGINNQGQIAGTYTDDRCLEGGCAHPHGFLATPVPETPSLLLLISGVISLIALPWRKRAAIVTCSSWRR